MNASAEQRVRPGKTGYWIALLIFVLGCGGSGWLLYDGISSLTEGLVRAEVPGETTITLDKAGTWTVFHESPSVFEGRTYNAPIPSAARISLRSPDGDEIPMNTSVGNFNYDFGGRSGVSVGSFRIDRPGAYTIIGTWPSDAPSDATVVALGHEKGKATVKTVFGVVGILISGLIAALIFIIVVILRSRSKNRLREAGVSGPPAP